MANAPPLPAATLLTRRLLRRLTKAAADRPAVAVIARAFAGVAVSHNDPVQPQPRAVHVEDTVDVVAVDDGQLRAPLAILRPHEPLRLHGQWGSHQGRPWRRRPRPGPAG